MRTDTVEIYSDATNAAVLRHPGRKFPGILLQGDTLHQLLVAADATCKASQGKLNEDALDQLIDLRNQLSELLAHYKAVLAEHQIRVPFPETPDA